MIKLGQKPLVDEIKCIGDGICVNVCPARPNVFLMEDVSRVVHPEACVDGCTECVDNCPTGAIRILRF